MAEPFHDTALILRRVTVRSFPQRDTSTQLPLSVTSSFQPFPCNYDSSSRILTPRRSATDFVHAGRFWAIRGGRYEVSAAVFFAERLPKFRLFLLILRHDA